MASFKTIEKIQYDNFNSINKRRTARALNLTRQNRQTQPDRAVLFLENDGMPQDDAKEYVDMVMEMAADIEWAG